MFRVNEWFTGFSVEHLPTGKSKWLSDGVDVIEGMSPGDPEFRQAWEDLLNEDKQQTLEAYFPELSGAQED